MAFDPFNKPGAPSYEAAYQEASRQTAANAAAYRPQRVNPQDMKAQLAQKLAAWRAQPVGANGRRALPVGTPQLPYQRVNPQDIYNQQMAAYQQQLAEWNRQKAIWDAQQAEAAAQYQNYGYGGEGGGGDGSPGGLGDSFGGANPGGDGGGYGDSGGGYGDAGGSPAGDGGGTMGGAMRRGGLVAKYSKGGLVSNSFSEMSRKLAKKRSK